MLRSKKVFAFFFLFFFACRAGFRNDCANGAFAQPVNAPVGTDGSVGERSGENPALKLSLSDLLLKTDTEGWHLYVRHKEGLSSVLLTETTKDPEGRADSYAYRALEFNEINGNEKRLLNGAFLDSEFGRYGIIDSTPEEEADFGNAFHLFIPKKLVYGYPWGRSGEVTVEEGTFINIRTFEKPYADYSGGYADNPFMFGFNAALTDEYSPAAAEAFKDIASGIMIYSHGPDTIVEDVMRSFKELPKDQNADVVFAVDATGSMWDDIQKLQKELIPALASELKERSDVRLGLLFYRDYTDDFRFRGLPVQFNDFTRDAEAFFSKLNAMHIPQHSLIGGDTPEAVYEALYASLEFYRWSPFAQKKIILIGDAEPHPSPRAGKGISKKLVEDTARKKEVTIDCIIIPDGKAGRR